MYHNTTVLVGGISREISEDRVGATMDTSALPFPADIMVKVAMILYNTEDGRLVAVNVDYHRVVRLCMSCKEADRVIRSETTRRYAAIASRLKSEQGITDQTIQMMHAGRKRYWGLLPTGWMLRKYESEIIQRWKSHVHTTHVAKVREHSGGKECNDIEWKLSLSISQQLVDRYVEGGPRISELPEAADVVILRVHSLSQAGVNRCASFADGDPLVNGMKDNDRTYLVLPGDHIFDKEQEDCIHALFGHHFRTTIGRMKEALEEDAQTVMSEMTKQYDSIKVDLSK